MRSVVIPTLVLVLAGCQSTSPPAAHPVPGVVTTSSPTTGGRSNSSIPSTTAVAQTSGVRTVLSPVGLNLRAEATKTATVVGTAAQGTTLTVLAHSDQGGGWFQVKGATVTGWISDNPRLSAQGKFMAYTSSEHQFDGLYPDGWTVAEVPPSSVAFHPPAGADTIVATTAATAALLGRGRPGYRLTGDEQVVACGVTASLVTFTQVSTPATTGPPAGGPAGGRYLAQVRLTLDAQHALGIDGNLADLAAVQTVRDFVNSLTFPFPKCEQVTPTPTSVP